MRPPLPPAVFLDRDGVLNHESAAFILAPEQWRPLPGSLDAVARLHRAGVPVAVATNQSAVGRGLLSPRDLERIHDRMQSAVAQAGGRLAGIAHCPHGPDAGCACRKPAPGLLLSLLAELGLSAAGTLFVGDSARDLEAAARAGVAGVLVRTGNGARHLAEGLVPPTTPVYDDLAAVVDALLGPEPGR